MTKVSILKKPFELAWLEHKHDVRSNALAIYYLNFMYRTQKLFSSHFHFPMELGRIDGRTRVVGRG